MTSVAPRGWCPTLFAPMESGDGLLARVRPPGCMLTVTQAHALAGAAACFGNGIVELGHRASVQVRGLSVATMPGFTQAMLAAGLALPDPAAESRRSVIAPPLAGSDPALAPRAGAMAAALEVRLAGAVDLAGLSGKFGCLVDGGGVLPLGGVAADIVLRVDGDVCLAAPDGSALAARCLAEAAPDVAVALLRAFLALAPTVSPAPRRMRGLVAALGAQAVLAAAGLEAEAVAPLAQPATTAGWLAYDDVASLAPPARGRTGFAQGACLAALPFGATDAATLHALADLTIDGLLRVTPFRAFAFAGVADPAPFAALGLITDPADPRLRVAACPGAPACTSARLPTRADAARLAALDLPGTLHVSGCAKGCAHPAAADLVLTGEGGHYALLRHGRAGDAPQRRGLTIDAALSLLQPEGRAA